MIHTRELAVIAAEKSKLAPDWEVQQWFNTEADLGLSDFRGRAVVLHAFQMLCPGCVSHGIPQAQKIHAMFSTDEVSVIGLHTVFEHHSAMTPVSLEAFIHEYRIPFPVGVDTPGEDKPTPKTMARYGMRGTPSLIVIDPLGRLRFHGFGRPEDLQVGAILGSVLAEPQIELPSISDEATEGAVCTPEGCS